MTLGVSTGGAYALALALALGVLAAERVTGVVARCAMTACAGSPHDR